VSRSGSSMKQVALLSFFHTGFGHRIRPRFLGLPSYVMSLHHFNMLMPLPPRSLPD